MMSVRGRITVFILVPLFIVAAFVGYWAYKNTRARAEARFDEGLLATASAISRDIAASGGDALSISTRDLIRDTSGGKVFYHVYAPDGVFVTGYATPPVASSRSAVERTQFYDGIYHGSSVRVLRLKEQMRMDGLQGLFSFTVWQDTVVREAFVSDQAWQTFVVIATLGTSVVFIVWIGVGIGLRPLLDLQDAISMRSSTDLTPIRRAVPSEVKGVVATLNSLLEQVDTSMQAKNVFISNAAHQLRNPVAGIMAMAEAVKSAPDAKSAVERTQDLYESAQEASELANKLISFERANQSAQSDLYDIVDLVAVVTSAVHLAERRLPEIVTLSLLHDASSIDINGDSLMLEEAVANLIDNAIKYGGPGMTTISVQLSRLASTVRIEVIDDGVGMSEQEMVKAMERFGQVNPGRGTGLGLSIVQSVARGHSGSFQFEQGNDCLKAVMVLPLLINSELAS